MPSLADCFYNKAVRSKQLTMPCTLKYVSFDINGSCLAGVKQEKHDRVVQFFEKNVETIAIIGCRLQTHLMEVKIIELLLNEFLLD